MNSDELKATNAKPTENRSLTAFVPVNSLLLLVLLQLLSHQTHSPLWLSGFIGLICLFKFLADKSHTKKIPFMLRTVLMLSSTGVFILYYRNNFSVDMAASFLFLAAALKLLEIDKQKDVVVFIFSMLYLSAVSFLFEQSILHTLLQFVSVTLCFYILFIINPLTINR